MTPEQAKQFMRSQGQKLARWARSSKLANTANSAVGKPFNEFDVAVDELQAAYRAQMATVMSGVVQARSPSTYLAWLTDGERCISQFHLAREWIEVQKSAH